MNSGKTIFSAYQAIWVFVLLALLTACSSAPQKTEPVDEVESVLKDHVPARVDQEERPRTVLMYEAAYPGLTRSNKMNWGWGEIPLREKTNVEISNRAGIDKEVLDRIYAQNLITEETQKRLAEADTEYVLVALRANLEQLESELATQSESNSDVRYYLANPSFNIVTSNVLLVPREQFRVMARSSTLSIDYSNVSKGQPIQIVAGAATLKILPSQIIAYRSHYICDTREKIKLCSEPSKAGKKIIASKGEEDTSAPDVLRKVGTVVIAPYLIVIGILRVAVGIAVVALILAAL